MDPSHLAHDVRSALAEARAGFDALERKRARLQEDIAAKDAFLSRTLHGLRVANRDPDDQDDDDDAPADELSPAERQAAVALEAGEYQRALDLYAALESPHAQCAYATLAVRYLFPQLEEDDDFADKVRQAFDLLLASGSPLSKACDAERAVFLSQIDEDFEGAMDAYDRAAEWNPLDANVLYNYANFLSLQLDLSEQAEAAYRQCLEADAEHVNALNNLASLLVETARAHVQPQPLLLEARSLLERAQALAPGLPAYNMACIDALLGEFAACENHLRAALDAMDNITVDDLTSDPDLEPVRKAPWFVRLCAEQRRTGKA